VSNSIHHKSQQETDPRRWQLIVGLGILGVLILVVPALYIVWQFVPGVLGDWLGVIAGVLSTPFLLEIFFVIAGLIIVIGLNHLRQKRDGDEFVYLDDIKDASSAADTSDHTKRK
jgi:hypothetical protein